MKSKSIIRILDEETFFIGIGKDEAVKNKQYIEVLNPKRSYKNLAQVIETYDHYSICQKLGKKKVFFGDTVRLRPQKKDRYIGHRRHHG